MLLIFRKVKLVIIVVYILLNDKEEKKKIQQQVIKRLDECGRDRIKTIVMGDFNDIRSRELDQSKEVSTRKQDLPLLRWLANSNFEDVFKKIYLYKKEFTWTNKISSTRIDYIWASKSLSQSII